MVVGGATFVAGGVLAVVQGVGSPDLIKLLLGVLLVVIGALLMLTGVANFRVARQLRKWAATRPSRIVGRTDPTRVPAAVSPGPLTFVEHRLSDDTPAANPSAPQDCSTLFLRMFKTETSSLLVRLTRVGPVYMLLGGDGLVPDLFDGPRVAFGKIDHFIEESEDEILKRLATFNGRRRVLGYYRRCTMICSDDVWTFALDRMLERARIVIVDLCGFTPGSAGLEYEFGVVLDRVPLGRVVFVTGPETERVAFDAKMRHLWATLPETSINYSTGEVEVHVAVTTALSVNTSRRDEESQRKLALQSRELNMVVGLIGAATQPT